MPQMALFTHLLDLGAYHGPPNMTPQTCSISWGMRKLLKGKRSMEEVCGGEPCFWRCVVCWSSSITSNMLARSFEGTGIPLSSGWLLDFFHLVTPQKVRPWGLSEPVFHSCFVLGNIVGSGRQNSLGFAGGRRTARAAAWPEIFVSKRRLDLGCAPLMIKALVAAPSAFSRYEKQT